MRSQVWSIVGSPLSGAVYIRKEGKLLEVCNLHIETISMTFEHLFEFGISNPRDLKVDFDLLPATLNFVYMIRIFRRHFPKSKFKTRNKTITKKFNGRMRDGMLVKK